MPTIYVDADACPVKPEVYKVAGRYGIPVVVVANSPMMVPSNPPVELVVVPGFGAADDWIAGKAGPGDIAVTADVPLAARCVAAGAVALSPKGRLLDANTVGEALAVRDLMEGLRTAGTATGGPAPMTAKDRSRFLAELDKAVHAARRVKPPTRPPRRPSEPRPQVAVTAPTGPGDLEVTDNGVGSSPATCGRGSRIAETRSSASHEQHPADHRPPLGTRGGVSV
ncbi:MAG: YaiI/YqxD family protein [Gemmataceae bacterium]